LQWSQELGFFLVSVLELEEAAALQAPLAYPQSNKQQTYIVVVVVCLFFIFSVFCSAKLRHRHKYISKASSTDV
jgi:hypothetical protein